MVTVACVLLSVAGFYFSIGLGEQWWLAWIAPLPVLWLALDLRRSGWTATLAAWAAYALGQTNILRAYAGLIPGPVLLLASCGPALLFALAVLAARQALRSLGPVAALFAFATVWAGLDWVSSFNTSGGSISTPAAAEMAAPALIQSASLVGFMGITFLLGLFAAGMAVTLRTRRFAPAGIALAVFLANVVYGSVRISTPPTGSERVALIDSNDAVGAFRKDDRVAALKAIDAYAAQIVKLRDQHVGLIVLPENIARLAPEWRAEGEARLAAAANESKATVVVGFNTPLEGAQRNISWAFVPGADQPVTYEKRRLVPVLESAVFTPGPGPKSLADGTGLEICKDMDFHAMIRTDAVSTRPALLAVPAWDFVRDDWSHARVAVLRSVENGLPMARSARQGLLTLNDRYGRLVAVTRTVDGFKTLIGDLPLDGRGGQTVYDRIGDMFGWLCLGSGIALFGWAVAQGRKPVPETPGKSASNL